MKRISVLIILSLFYINTALSQEDSSFYEFIVNHEDGFDLFTQQATFEYNQYVIDFEIAYQQYVDNIKKYWGEDTKLDKLKKEEYVEYSDDLKSRMVVDFKKGKIIVEAIVNSEEKKEVVISNAVKEHSKTVGKQIVKESTPTKIGTISLLSNQIANLDIKKLNKVEKKVVSSTGKTNTIISLEIKLAPNHIKERANLYLGFVDIYSKKYKLEPELVLAMIHTESYFNPQAKSYANAYGLMQLVPKYGGRAAYRFVTGKDKIPTPEYLYIPKNNIELGCAYLNLLMTNIFGNVTNKNSQLYCTVASYNCGAGRLSTAFISSKNVKKAIGTINNKTEGEVFSILTSKLPAETQKYLKVVVERKKQYKDWVKN